ncbi:MAG: transposase [Nitrospirae bacterium]|nr:transposase [Nitrospirota bacterium]
MARLPRFFVPGYPLHVIQRGNNREAVFSADADYSRYLEWLTEAANRHGCAIHAYVLMTNHVHLLLTPAHASSLPKTLQSLGRRYVQYVNRTYERTGTLWEGRYRATLIDSDSYLLTCCRYIELNPVRAEMVRHPREYPWSSYHVHAEGKKDSLMTPHPLYHELGRTAAARQKAYRELFRRHLSGETLEVIREATNKAWVLGSERFMKRLARKMDRRVSPLPRGRPPSELE